MTTGKRIGRRALGTTLALLILLSCTFAAAPGIAGTLRAAAAGSVTFVVPETIYLSPTNDSAGSKTMQCYLNVNADGTVPQGFSGTGYVRFSNAAANSVRITCSDSSVTLSTSSGTNEINATIGGQLSSGLASGQTRTLTWTAQYTENGQTKTVRSFSVVYAPFANPVGAIAGAVADKGSSVYASCSTLIYGVQQVVNSYTMNETFLSTQPEPFYDYGEPNGVSRVMGTGVYRYSLANIGVTPPVYDGYGVPDNLLTNINTSTGSPSQSGVAFGCASGLDTTQRVLVFGGTGRVYYDTSRVTKIGQIPNISVRSFLNGAGCTGSFSNCSDDFHAKALYLTADTSVSNPNASYSTTTYWSNTYDREDVYTIPTNGDFCNYALSGGVKSLVSVVNRFWRAVPAVFGGNSSSKTDATAVAVCEFHGIDKSTARARYLSEVSAARQCGSDAAVWSNYQAQMQAVAEYLGTPMATSVDLTALNNAVSALVLSQRTTLTVDPNGGKWQNNSTAVRTYTQNDGSTFTLSDTPSRDGYTFDGWELVSGGGTLNGSVYTFGAANGTVRAKWTGTPILTLDLNGGYWTDNHSTENRTVQKTGDIPYTLPDNPKRDGYVFSGWLMENGNISGGVYRFGDADETLTAQWFEYTNTFIEFGSYPQTKVTDETLLTALNAAPQVWRSYGYYVGLGNGDADGRIFESNSMQYCDVTYNGQKYRGVKFSQYRPYYTNVPSSATYSMQDENGYAPNTTYWFRWEPLTWRVLDPDTGLVLCEPIIDSQAYNNLVFYDSETDRRYGDTAKTYYASNYEHSNLRAWLTDATLSTSFLNTAFTSAQSGAILETTLDNRALREDYAEYDSASTTDKIFLLSYEDVLNQSYGFPSVNIQSDERKAPATDYAKCQGIGRSISTEYFPWRLRTPDMNSWQVTLVNFDGGRMGFGGYRADSTDIGVRPAMRLDLNAAATLADAATLTIHPNGGIWSDHSTAPKTITQNAGSTYTLSAVPSRDGYTFDGWELTSGGGSLSGNNYTFGAENGTVRAKWRQNQTPTITSTLYINPNGGRWPDGTTQVIPVQQTAGTTYTLTLQPIRDGYIFSGWTLSGTDGTLNGNVFTFGASNCAVNAQWTKESVCRLYLDPNGGRWSDGTTTTRVYPEDPQHPTASLPIELCRLGYVLSGWEDADGNVYVNDGSGCVDAYYYGDTDETLTAKWTAIPNDFVEFGSYPQTRVTDDSLIAALNAADPSWFTCSFAGSTESDIRYCDVTVDGVKYRGIQLQSYRTQIFQNMNGYSTGATYWFRWEPLQWRVLDPDTGLVMCETLINAQPFNKTASNNYAQSYIRAWLTDDANANSFVNTAFSAKERSAVLSTTLDNSAFSSDYSVYDGAATTDKVFLLSWSEISNTDYGFSAFSNTPNYDFDLYRKAWGTDYARCFGLNANFELYAPWLLRTPGFTSESVCFLNYEGSAAYGLNAATNYLGIRPAMRVDLAAVTAPKPVPHDQISVTIGDQIGVNLLLDLDARPDAQYVTVTYKDLSGNEQTETFTDFASLPQVDGGLYKIAVQIAPAQIADSVTVYIDGETLDACVKDYCNTLIEGEYEPEVAALAQAVLDYGQAANNYFDYSDETLSALADLSADDARAWQSKFSDTTGKIQNVSFMALTKPEFRFYMKNMTEAEAAAFNSAGITAVYEDSNITEPLRARFVRNTNGSILLEVTGVLAERMDQKIIVTIPGLGTITFAGNDFARMMAMSENGAIETLGAALYAYGEAAKACFVNA